MPSAKMRARPNARAAPDLAEPGWRLRRRPGTEYLAADALAEIPWLVHGFSTRKGGASLLHGARVLNLGFADWDSRQAVASNRKQFAHAAGADGMPLLALRQIHSDVVHRFSGLPPEPLQADGALTRRANLLLSVQIADCVPVLLADAKRRAVAAVHAGWRGTLARILAKAIGRMRVEFGTDPKDVRAAIGPSIGRCCYEVGPEVAQEYASQFAPAAEWFEGPFERLAFGEEPNPLPWLTMMPPGHEPPPERVRLDLRAANRWQLLDSGVPARNIACSTLCTACRTDLFFSYRREGAQTGRLMAVIGMSTPARRK